MFHVKQRVVIMKAINTRVLVGDFETTVYEGQLSTEVWASAVVELGTEDVKIHHSIAETWEYLISLKSASLSGSV